MPADKQGDARGATIVIIHKLSASRQWHEVTVCRLLHVEIGLKKTNSVNNTHILMIKAEDLHRALKYV